MDFYQWAPWSSTLLVRFGQHGALAGDHGALSLSGVRLPLAPAREQNLPPQNVSLASRLLQAENHQGLKRQRKIF